MNSFWNTAFLFGLAALPLSLFASEPLKQVPILPSVAQGTCTVCGTASCADCPKLTSIRRAVIDQESVACS